MTEIEEVRMSGAPVATVARPKGAVASLLLATLGFFLITLDVSIVNLALPSMAADLGGDTSAQQWILDGYTLFFAALLLFAGNLSDRLGAKRAYVIGIAAFAVTSLLGALAPTMSFLIGARCVHGIAAALMLPASMTLVREAFPDSAPRARALGVWAAGGAVASAAGPILGGVLSSWDWRLVFLVNVPVCAVMLLLFIRVARSPGRPSRFDWAGQLLALIALGTLIYALIEGGVVGYTNPVIIGLFLLGAVALAAFIGVQARTRTPMMPLTLFRSGAMRVAFFGGFVFIFAWFGIVFLASLYLQQHLGMPAALAGLVFLPAALGSFVGNLSSGPLTNRVGPRVPAALGIDPANGGPGRCGRRYRRRQPVLGRSARNPPGCTSCAPSASTRPGSSSSTRMPRARSGSTGKASRQTGSLSSAPNAPCDRDLTELIIELSDASADFRRRWASHDVHRHSSGV